jgi:hypothetical protein
LDQLKQRLFSWISGNADEVAANKLEGRIESLSQLITLMRSVSQHAPSDAQCMLAEAILRDLLSQEQRRLQNMHSTRTLSQVDNLAIQATIQRIQRILDRPIDPQLEQELDAALGHFEEKHATASLDHLFHPSTFMGIR